MKKNTFLFLFFCFSFLFSQEKSNKYTENYFPIKYILKKSKDTVKTKVQNVGIDSNKGFSPITYIHNMYVLNSSGDKIKIAEDSIQYMQITDLKNVKRRFISSASILSKDIGLLEIMYKGKISWYRNNYYKGPIYTAKISKRDFLLDHKSKTITEIGFMSPGVRDQLKEIFSMYPDLTSMVDSMVVDTDLLKILRLYDRKR
ncbi:hypothetical protein [Chryseobacterium fistulae]|uniref:Uncharacterized protein n=1 Tax=Chryseobacterium fistulae TaxID=2675058 RepID=A0A6N4XT77_9FLAO|nr:hypothetical protein [Chryseobacterium fistulae]CAA7387396.1 hypothetical protein CHRY9393_01625 [Chryseobacterium fistulae]